MNWIRLAIVLLSALIYTYTALTTWRTKSTPTRTARVIIAVYAFTIGVANITALHERSNIKTYLLLVATVAAAAWALGDVAARLRAGKSVLGR